MRHDAFRRSVYTKASRQPRSPAGQQVSQDSNPLTSPRIWMKGGHTFPLDNAKTISRVWFRSGERCAQEFPATRAWNLRARGIRTPTRRFCIADPAKMLQSSKRLRLRSPSLQLQVFNPRFEHVGDQAEHGPVERRKETYCKRLPDCGHIPNGAQNENYSHDEAENSRDVGGLLKNRHILTAISSLSLSVVGLNASTSAFRLQPFQTDNSAKIGTMTAIINDVTAI